MKQPYQCDEVGHEHLGQILQAHHAHQQIELVHNRQRAPVVGYDDLRGLSHCGFRRNRDRGPLHARTDHGCSPLRGRRGINAPVCRQYSA